MWPERDVTMTIRICVTGLRGFPDIMGGIEAHCQNIYPRMRAMASDLEFVVFGRAPYLPNKSFLYEGVRIQPLWTIRQKHLETFVHTLLSLLRARFVERADIVHIHAVGPNLLTPLARALGLAIVATHHGDDYRRLKWGWAARTALRLGENLMVRFAHRVICVSDASARKLRTRYPAHAPRISYIPNGAAFADDVTADETVLDTLGLRGQPFVLTVGRLVPEKGFQDLIAAFLRRENRLKLVIVGGADHDDRFSAELRQRASAHIVFAGRRNKSELVALYRATALFVLPSYHEGHPIAALEALSLGAPVLLSDIEPNLEIGLLPQHYFPLGDINALSLIFASNNFSKYKEDYSTLLERYDWSQIAARTAATLSEALAERDRG